MSRCPVPAAPAVHPVLLRRRSPATFRPDAVIGERVAHMTLQAMAIGVDAHQFRAFDRDAVAAEFGVPRQWEVTSMTAFGVADGSAGEVLRERRSRDDVTWARDREASAGGTEPA
ncbi:hypothetical protein [Tsukamurella sp. 1534]|uniref:hypothetical protein n=1 Tax=Tsukamurella sp. 1534 TaxID=1151061 RepID=UPI0006ACD0BD|nr:hypothetical protein [Tsukamurella sp. 1534]